MIVRSSWRKGQLYLRTKNKNQKKQQLQRHLPWSVLSFPKNSNKMNNTSGISLHGYATYTELFVFSVSSIFQRSTDTKISAHTWILHKQDFCLNKPCRSLSLLLTPHAHLLLACSCSHCRNTKRALNASVLNTVNTTHQPFSFKALLSLIFPLFLFPASQPPFSLRLSSNGQQWQFALLLHHATSLSLLPQPATETQQHKVTHTHSCCLLHSADNHCKPPLCTPVRLYRGEKYKEQKICLAPNQGWSKISSIRKIYNLPHPLSWGFGVRISWISWLIHMHPRHGGSYLTNQLLH